MLESPWAIRFLKVSDAEAPEDVKATLDVFHLVEEGWRLSWRVELSASCSCVRMSSGRMTGDSSLGVVVISHSATDSGLPFEFEFLF
jgi:hypothetical protein